MIENTDSTSDCMNKVKELEISFFNYLLKYQRRVFENTDLPIIFTEASEWENYFCLAKYLAFTSNLFTPNRINWIKDVNLTKYNNFRWLSSFRS